MENDYEYVSVNDFDIRTSDLQKQINQMRTQVMTKQEIQAQIDESVADVGSSSLSVISLLLALLLAAFCVLMRNTLLARQKYIERLIKNPNNQEELIARFEQEIRLLNAKIHAIESASETVKPKETKPIETKPIKTEPIETESIETKQPIETETDISLKEESSTNDEASAEVVPDKIVNSETDSDFYDRYHNFVLEFNALAVNKTGLEAKSARDMFIKKFKVKAFSCANFNKLVNNPSIEPEFIDSASVQSGDYWAYEIDRDVFAVVPGVKTYTDNHHGARAMGKVFKSNFETGYTYNVIIVKKPAIFRGMWHIDKVGQLELN